MKFCDILNNNESENLLKEWLNFREEELSHMDENDKKCETCSSLHFPHLTILFKI